jgi:hypothetical protein
MHRRGDVVQAANHALSAELRRNGLFLLELALVKDDPPRSVCLPL